MPGGRADGIRSRRLIARALLVVVAALAVTAESAAARPAPAFVATVQGQVVAVAQGGGSLAWVGWSAFKCRLTIRATNGAEHSTMLGGCGLGSHDLALAGGGAVLGGYEDVRCSETEAMVRTAGSSATKVIEDIPGDCRGYGVAYRGLASDGKAVYYALLNTRPPTGASLDCGEGGGCTWRLESTTVVRVDGNAKRALGNVPPAVLIAGAPGRLALVQPASTAHSNGKSFDWPRAATGGKVALYDTADRRIVASFAPAGIVRAVALSSSRAAVLVQNGSAIAIEWYDAATGAKLGRATVPASTAQMLATDGTVAAYAVGNTVRVIDLTTGASRILAHTSGPPVGLSIANGRLAWGENSGSKGHVAVATLG